MLGSHEKRGRTKEHDATVNRYIAQEQIKSPTGRTNKLRQSKKAHSAARVRLTKGVSRARDTTDAGVSDANP